jgi:pilus assembly protein CpaD
MTPDSNTIASPRLRRLRLPVMLAALLALSGCVRDTSAWSPVQAPKSNKVDWVMFDHAVTFGRTGANLTEAEKGRLDRFLSEIAIGQADQILIGAAGKAIDPAARRLALRREAAVAAYLRQRRLTPKLLPRGIDDRRWDGRISIAVGRYVVTPPACPNWMKQPGIDKTNTASSNFGCADTTNLGLMVADPGDLVRGRTAGPGEAEGLTPSIQRWRKGERPALPTVTSTSGGTGGGGE